MCKYVLPLYAAYWKEIGIFLDVESGQLDVIKLNNPADANKCCIDLFLKWLQNARNVTWEKMFEAIDQATSIGSITITTAPTVITSK